MRKDIREKANEKSKKIKNKRKIRVVDIYLILILIAMVSMSVAAAQVTNITLLVTGTAKAEAPAGIQISNVTKTSESGLISDEIKYYSGTTLSSSVQLSTTASSNVVYSVTLQNNNSAGKYYFKGVEYVDEAYNNDKIEFVVDGLTPYITTIEGSETTKTFNLQFKYKDGITVSGAQTLDSLLNFVFSNETIQFTLDNQKYTVPAGATWEQFINSEYNTYGFLIEEDTINTYKYKEIYLLKDKVKKDDVIKAKTEYNYKPELTLDKETIEVGVETGKNTTATLTATIKNVKNAVPTWKSSDTNVVTISGTGTTVTLNLKTPGFATITANYGKDVEATCKVIIKEKYVKEINNTIAGIAENYKIYGNSVQYGTPTPDSPVEIQSVGDKTKNLFDINNVNLAAINNSASTKPPKIENDIIYSGGRYGSSEGACLYIDTLGEQNWAVSFNCSYAESEVNRYYRIYLFNEFDENGFVSNANRLTVTTVNNNNTVIVDATGYKYIGIIFYSNTQYGLEITNLQFEQGTTATEYEPYGYKIPVKVSNGTEERITNIYLNEPLRKVGDLADYIDFASKNVVRKTGEATNIASLNWMVSSNYFQAILGVNVNTENRGSSLCNYLKYGNAKDDKAFWIDSSGTGIRIVSSNYTSVDMIKEWLETSSIYIVYPLATQTEETIDLPELSLCDGYTKIEVLTEVAPSNMEVTVSKPEIPETPTDPPIITLNQEDFSVVVVTGNTTELTLIATCENVVGEPTWTSSNTNIAEIVGTGNTRTIIVKQGGTVTITVSYGTVSAKCTINVIEEAGPS